MVKGVEIVRTGPMELPSLPLWNATQSPLQLSDWLLFIETIVADLSASADVWWKTVVQESEVWYQAHMPLSPLERLQHGHEVPLALNQTRWQRLERRVSTMMLQAVPDQIREELVSSRRMSVFAIVTHLYVAYCPGGISEKQNLLKSLRTHQRFRLLVNLLQHYENGCAGDNAQLKSAQPHQTQLCW